LTIIDGNCTDMYCDTISVDEDGLFGFAGDGGVRSQLTINVIQQISTSVDEMDANDQISLWPNPASDLLHISTGGTIQGSTTVTSMDQNRRVVRSMSRNFNVASEQLTIPVAELAIGMYRVRIEDGGNTVVQRFARNQ